MGATVIQVIKKKLPCKRGSDDTEYKIGLRKLLKLRFDHAMKQHAREPETSNGCHVTKGKSDGATRQCEKRKIHGGDGHIRVTDPATIEVLMSEKPSSHQPVQIKITIMRRP